MTEYDVTASFGSTLQAQLGYPTDAFLHEFPLKDQSGVRRRLADLIIQDAQRSRLLAIIEFKREFSDDIVRTAFNQTAEYSRLLGLALPEYVVVGANELKPPFRIFTQDSDRNTVELSLVQFPSYAALVSGQITIETERIVAETQQKRDDVRVVCNSAAALLLVIFILSVSGCLTLTTTQLGLIAGIVGLLLLPHAAKLKGLGIEFERLKKDNEE